MGEALPPASGLSRLLRGRQALSLAQIYGWDAVFRGHPEYRAIAKLINRRSYNCTCLDII